MRTFAVLTVLIVAGLALSQAAHASQDVQSRSGLTDLAKQITCSGRAAAHGIARLIDLIQHGYFPSVFGECWRVSEGNILKYLQCMINVPCDTAALIGEKMREYYDVCIKGATFF